MVSAQKPIKGPQSGTKEWYDLRLYNPDRPRKVIIGASEAAAACNVSPYSSALQLYMEKRGEFQKEFSPEQARRIDLGKRLEPVILDAYAEQRSCYLERDLPVYFHPAFWWMAATPDAIASVQSPEGDLSEWCVDAKSTNWRMLDKTGSNENRFGEDGTDQIPIDYLCQAQQQMAVMGLEACEFPVLIDAAEIRIYTVGRNDDLIAQIASAEKELAERIIAGDPPEPNWTHAGTVSILHKLHPLDVGKVIDLTEEDADRWTRKELLSEQVKTLEREIDEIKAHIMWALGDAQIGRCVSSGVEIKRTVIADSIVTQRDVEELSRKVGQVKRAGHSRLTGKRIG